MPANPEQTRCFKNLWDYELDYEADSFGSVLDEIECSRDECSGFAPYRAGFTPAQHLEIQLEQLKEEAALAARAAAHKSMPKSFDVFISYTRRDKPEVRHLAEALRRAGLAVWFDEWELLPGAPWQDALEIAIAASGAALVVIGADGIGPWQETEVAAALQYTLRERRPVIPVLLPGVRPAKLPPFLSRITSVEIKSWDDSDFAPALQNIIWGITGRPPILPERDRIPKVFLCHAKEDDAKVRGLYFRLRDLGLDPWYDKEKLLVGDRWEQEIIDAIENTDFFAICLSAKSVRKTGFIQREIKAAVKEYQRRPQQLAYLLPVRLEPCDVPRLKLDDVTTLSDLQWINVFEDEEDALKRFAEGVKKRFEESRESAPNTAPAPDGWRRR